MRVSRLPAIAILISAVGLAGVVLLGPDREPPATDPAAPDKTAAVRPGLTPPAPMAFPIREAVSLSSTAAASIDPRATRTPPQEDFPKDPYDRTLEVGKGDTLMQMLVGAGLGRGEAHQAIDALARIYNPRRILPGHQVTLTFQPDPSGAEDDRFVAMTLATGVEREVHVTLKDEGGFTAKQIDKVLVPRLDKAHGTIDSSLYLAATGAGLPDPVLMELIRAFSWDVDFQRDIQPGDAFEAMYETLYTEDGVRARNGRILFASLTLSGKRKAIYLHELKDGGEDYFDEQGRTAKKALMRTPVNGARLSSGFGNRKHPILGYNRMHRGVDFAAPTGTPIYAAGDGTIDFIGNNGGYGKFIRIRHNSEFSTAYAHMNGFRKGMQRGKRVRQGEVIGYVGSTGSSTGPHLHYEVLRNGQQVNPLQVTMPSGQKLAGAELKAFEKTKARLDEQYASLPGTELLAANEGQQR